MEAMRLNVFYGDFHAVHDVNLAFGKNEITALIGPSGCGKSTVLRCLNRMNDLVTGARVEGEVTYHGKNIYARDVDPIAVRTHIGMVFQKPNPFPKSIYDNIAYGPRVTGMKVDNMDDLVEQALRGAALWDEVKDKLKQSAYGLSGGQQQRLCIARTIATQARRDLDGRALLRARPDRHRAHRGPDARAARRVHDHHRHPQHAAGGPGLGPHGVLHRPAGRDHRQPHRAPGGVRPHQRDLLHPRRTSAPRTTSRAASAEAHIRGNALMAMHQGVHLLSSRDPHDSPRPGQVRAHTRRWTEATGAHVLVVDPREIDLVSSHLASRGVHPSRSVRPWTRWSSSVDWIPRSSCAPDAAGLPPAISCRRSAGSGRRPHGGDRPGPAPGRSHARRRPRRGRAALHAATVWDLLQGSGHALDDHARVPSGRSSSTPVPSRSGCMASGSSDLPLKEFELLRALLYRAPEVMTNEELRASVWAQPRARCPGTTLWPSSPGGCATGSRAWPPSGASAVGATRSPWSEQAQRIARGARAMDVVGEHRVHVRRRRNCVRDGGLT